jgi:hypothetical protein
MYWSPFHAFAGYLPIISPPMPGLSDPSVSQWILEQCGVTCPRLLTLSSSWRGSVRSGARQRSQLRCQYRATCTWGELTFQHETSRWYKQLQRVESSLISWYLLSWSRTSSFCGTWGFITMFEHAIGPCLTQDVKKKKKNKAIPAIGRGGP